MGGIESRYTGRNKIGVAVVGLGVGEQHARTYNGIKQCELRWLYDLNHSKSKALANEFGTGTPARSYNDILRDHDTQLVSIASYDDAHSRQVVEALDAGKHVFVEKPLCCTMDELRSIKNAWSKHRGRIGLYSNLVLRSAPLYCWLKEELGNGSLGDVYAFYGDYLYGRINKLVDGWRGKIDNYSVMLGGGVHLVDLMLWLTNSRPASVFAMGNRICTTKTDLTCCDFVAATLQFPSGLTGSINANFGCVHRHQHVLRIFGTKGTFIYDDRGARLSTTRDPAVSALSVDLAALPASKGELIAGFVNSIAKGKDTSELTQHEFDVISVCLAIDQALAGEKKLEVQYV